MILRVTQSLLLRYRDDSDSDDDDLPGLSEYFESGQYLDDTGHPDTSDIDDLLEDSHDNDNNILEDHSDVIHEFWHEEYAIDAIMEANENYYQDENSQYDSDESWGGNDRYETYKDNHDAAYEDDLYERENYSAEIGGYDSDDGSTSDSGDYESPLPLRAGKPAPPDMRDNKRKRSPEVGAVIGKRSVLREALERSFGTEFGSKSGMGDNEDDDRCGRKKRRVRMEWVDLREASVD